MIASFSSPLPARSVATGDVWLHELKLDGYRRAPPSCAAGILLKCRAALLAHFLTSKWPGLTETRPSLGKSWLHSDSFGATRLAGSVEIARLSRVPRRYELALVVADIISAHCPGTSARARFLQTCIGAEWGEAASMVEGMLAEP